MLESIVVENNDVLVCYRPHLKERDCYFVLSIGTDYYDVVKLKTEDFLEYKVCKREKLLKSRYICCVNKLTDDQIESINNQIRKQYTLKKRNRNTYK